MSVVQKMLSLRFGPLDEAACSRIAAASNAELEQVTERLLSASTLEDALGLNGSALKRALQDSWMHMGQ